MKKKNPVISMPQNSGLKLSQIPPINPTNNLPHLMSLYNRGEQSTTIIKSLTYHKGKSIGMDLDSPNPSNRNSQNDFRKFSNEIGISVIP